MDVQVAGLVQFSQTPRLQTQSSRRLHQVDGMTAASSGGFVRVLLVATISLAAMSVAHAVFCVGWRRMLKETVPHMLLIPCAEVLVTGFMLVGLSFYASIPLGPGLPADEKKMSGIAVHMALCLPYTAFLLWMARQRCLQSPSQSGNASASSTANEVRSVVHVRLWWLT